MFCLVRRGMPFAMPGCAQRTAMNHSRLPVPREPFELLAWMTTAALTGPASAGTEAPAPRARKARASWLDRFERWLWIARQRELERVLANASDIVDLEARLRDRERRLLQRYY